MSFVAGVVAGDLWRPGAPAAVVLGLAGVLCLLGAWAIHRRQPDPGPGDLLPRVGASTALLLLAGSAAVGCADLGVRAAVLESSGLPRLDGRVVTLQGRVASDPEPVGRGWSYTLRSVSHGGSQATGRMLVRSFGKPPAVELGDRVAVEVKVAKLDPNDPFDARLSRRGVAATARAVGPVEVIATTGNPLLAASNHFRQRMRSTSGRWLASDQSALLQALVIGDERGISERVEDDFRASGLSHLTAVSGANLAMVLAALAFLLALLRAPRRLTVVAGLVAVVVFTVVTRWEPSVLRAAVMASVALAAFLFGRLSNPAHALMLAFIGLLAFDPMMLWSVGFQLSFLATAGILWLRPPLIDRLVALPRAVAEPVAIGIAAQVAVFPLIALHFGRISIAAVTANLVAFALVAPITILGLAGGVASLVSPVAAWPFLKLAGFLVLALQWIAKTFGRSPASQMSVPNFKVSEAIAAYLVIAAVWLVLAGRSRWARWPAVAGSVVLVGATLVPALGSSTPAGLRVTFFDVGEGDAALVESPAGARLLVDGGRDPDLVAATLRRRGFERVDLVVASHLHADHVIGLQQVLRRFEVGLALHPGVPAPLLPTLTAEHPVEAAMDGESIRLGDLTVEVLGPTPDLREAAALSVTERAGAEGPGLNDASVVLRVNWAGQCVLFTGDIEDAGQQDLLDRHAGRVDCTVMKAPHHGSGRLLPEFVEAVDPEWVAVSVGPNTYGHPSP
ncbi:MAG TPA: ComEC/Rec2 family competence protein, partial [Actinomycetota bacterium]|nr:ComEC/Rec2 family competence protein [Actinomycetota bacterium]